MSALRRWWEWETRLFRKDSGSRPGQRAGLLVGLAIVLVGIMVTVLPLTTR